MLRTLVLFAVMVLLVLPACGTSAREAEQPLELAILPLYVDAQYGDDLNDGSSEAPFRTISRALALVLDGGLIDVAPGFYDEKHGETFPLVVPDGVTLSGDPSTSGLGTSGVEFTTIVGLGPGPAGLASLILGSNCALTGFYLLQPHDSTVLTHEGTGVFVSSGAATIRQCTIHGFEIGARFEGGANAPVGVIASTVFQECITGAWFELDAAVTRVEGNSFTHCWAGVWTHGPSPDLGGGVTSSGGQNSFACNLSAIAAAKAGGPVAFLFYTVSARGNFFDELPLTVGPPENFGIGPDIAIHFGASVDYAPAFDGASCPAGLTIPGAVSRN